MKRFTRDELLHMNTELENEAMGLRILTTCLLNMVQPYSVQDIEFWSDESTDYREVWSHYRPDSACGGVILIEQFEKETGRRLAHRTMLGTQLNQRDLGRARQQAAKVCYRNQFESVGVS